MCALFAATHPDRASALIVYGPEARGTATRDYPWAWTSEDWQAYLAEMETGWGTEDYGTRWFRRLMPSAKGDDPEQEQWWLTMHRGSASPSSIVAIERIWAELDIRPVLPTIQTPTLVLHRRDDPIEDVGPGETSPAGYPADTSWNRGAVIGLYGRAIRRSSSTQSNRSCVTSARRRLSLIAS